MKRWLLHIWLTGVLGILAASCSQVIDDPVTGDCMMEKEKVMIRFTIALDSPKVASRTWEGYDPDDSFTEEDELLGSETENYIDPTTVQVLIYDLNGILIGQLQDLTVTRDDESAGKHIYDLIGGFEVDSDYITNNKLNFKLMVFANCEPISNLNNLGNLTFTNPPTTTGSGIPMWGIATYENADVYTTVAEAQNKPLTTPIYMLRSMAKIEVTLDDDTKAAGYTLEGAILSKVMGSGYVLPAYKDKDNNELTLKTLEATTDLGVEYVLHAVEVNSNSSNVKSDEFHKTGDAYAIYVPEYQTSGVNDVPVISLNLKDGAKNDVYNASKQLFSFKHGYYDNDGIYTEQSMNIVRNHYYRYTVSIKDGRRLVLKLQVQPWNKVEEIWDYEETLTVTNLGKIQWNNIRNKSDNVVVINNEGIGQTTYCTFTITSPEEATWRTVLSPEHGAPQAFTFVTEEGKTIGMSTTGAVKDGQATLRIKPTSAVYAPNYHTARLLIYVEYKGRTQLAANLMPDGSTEQYYIIRQNPQ